MNDALRRGVRTFLQAFVGFLVLFAIPALQDLIRAVSSGEDYQFNFGFWQAIVVAAVASGLVALITWAQNELEDKGAIPALLKAPASSGADPVPDPLESDAVKP